MLGAPITIRVDDYVPSYNSYTQTLFAKVTNKGVWMNVLEKAFAKLYGNYSSLIGGAPERAVQALIGTPGSRTNVRAMTEDDMWNLIESSKTEDVMIAISYVSSYFGLTANHAYTLVDSFMVRKISGGEVRLLKLRDPWAVDYKIKS